MQWVRTIRSNASKGSQVGRDVNFNMNRIYCIYSHYIFACSGSDACLVLFLNVLELAEKRISIHSAVIVCTAIVNLHAACLTSCIGKPVGESACS